MLVEQFQESIKHIQLLIDNQIDSINLIHYSEATNNNKRFSLFQKLKQNLIYITF